MTFRTSLREKHLLIEVECNNCYGNPQLAYGLCDTCDGKGYIPIPIDKYIKQKVRETMNEMSSSGY